MINVTFAIMSPVQNTPTGSYASLSEDFNYLYKRESEAEEATGLSSGFLGLSLCACVRVCVFFSYYPRVQNPSETSVQEVCEM